MKVMFSIVAIMAMLCTADLEPAEAGSYYKVNLRAYRRMMRTDYPSPVGVYLGNFINDQVQRDGSQFNQIFDIFKEVLKNQADVASTDAAMVTTSIASPDPQLTASQAQLQRMCADLGIQYVRVDSATTPPAQVQGTTPPTGQGLDSSPLDGIPPGSLN